MIHRPVAVSLMHAVAAHAGLLAAAVALATVMIGAVSTIVLVALVPAKQRVEAIRAIPGVLSELLPWSARRPSPRQ
jgi:hypothetical protein